jgi:hypothetical protein
MEALLRPVCGALRIALIAVAATGQVHAQAAQNQGGAIETLWNCKDKEGRVTLTNQQADTVGKECRVVQQQRVTVVPAQKAPAKAGSPQNFPKESANDRLSSRDRQRQTLERELAQEESMLAAAKRKLAEQESVRSGDEKNYARVLERLQPYKDAVEVHAKNIDALKRELANLYR